jgi:hypothetical protein
MSTDPFHPTWPSLEAFYDEDERRRFSPEDDFGAQWCMEDSGDRHRLSRFSTTGEVVMVSPRSGRVELVAWTPDLKSCEKVLADWRFQHGPKSYYWVRKRFLVASGHRGAQERTSNIHMGDEVTPDLRDEAAGETLF